MATMRVTPLPTLDRTPCCGTALKTCCLQALGQPTSNAEADALIATLDTSGDGENDVLQTDLRTWVSALLSVCRLTVDVSAGSVSFQEFVEFIKPRILSKDMEKEVREQFEEFASQVHSSCWPSTVGLN